MAVLKVIKRTRMREQPSRTAPEVRRLEIDDEVTPTGAKQSAPKASGVNEEWQEAVFQDVNANVSDKGWVLSSDVQAGTETREDVDQGGFVREAILVQRLFNDVVPDTAPWLVSANFIIARALFETDLTNVEPKIPGSDGTGPLQVTTREWKLLADEGKAYGQFNEMQRESPLKQIYGAAYLMHHDAKEISKIKTPAAPADAKPPDSKPAPDPKAPAPADPKPAADAKAANATDPFIPSLFDVFNAYLTGSPAAAAALIDLSVSDAGKAKKITEALKDLIKVDDFVKARRAFAGTSEQPKTVGEYLTAVEAALDSRLKEAFEFMKEHAPEELLQVKQGEAPWLEVARPLIGVAEPDKRILDFFAATDFGRPGSTSTPWCGAFVAHCLKTSGNDGAAASIPKGAARAANWADWGEGIPAQPGAVPEGAIVVISPSEGTGTSGHVAFFSKFVENDSKVELLGGNQGNKVSLAPFLASRIMAVRWLDLGAGDNAGEVAGATPSNLPISHEATKRLVEFEVSSQKAYEARFTKPVWPGGRSGVTIGIGYDVGFHSADQVDKDWKGQIADNMIAALKSRAVGLTGSGAKSRATELAPTVVVPWKAANDVFRRVLIPRWVGIVQKALPNTDKLSSDCLGALLSLTYNRGPSFSKDGDRYREMRAIKDCMVKQKFDQIPGQIRAMKRLWPGVDGLLNRRDSEAQLFELGLKKK